MRSGGSAKRKTEDGEHDADIDAVVSYVETLSQPKLAAGMDADTLAYGAEVFAANCAGCHGEDARGMAELGAPDLTDAIWLYEGSVASIEAQLTQARHGMMPAWSEKLDDVTIKELAIYVHGLGGGQ